MQCSLISFFEAVNVFASLIVTGALFQILAAKLSLAAFDFPSARHSPVVVGLSSLAFGNKFEITPNFVVEVVICPAYKF